VTKAKKKSSRHAPRAVAGDGTRSVPATEGKGTAVAIGNKHVSLSNLGKPLYPTGFTKGQVIEYYVRIAPVMLPYLRDRAATMKRYPNGTEAPFFFEKNCPEHRPPWVKTARIESGRTPGESTNHCLIQDQATLAWVANLASLELHVPLAKASNPDRPTMMVFDLDPGAPATMRDCARIGLRLREMLEHLKLQCFAKTSGSKGLHVYVPLNAPSVTFEQTKTFALAVASLLAREDPARLTVNMSRSGRPGKVFIDWSQNDRHKTTVCPYSLRAKERPMVSTPVTWEEVEQAAGAKRPKEEELAFSTDDVLERVERSGDLFAPVLSLRQRVPELSSD
jgi:bifunctional non-homologous end joining protein LigD